MITLIYVLLTVLDIQTPPISDDNIEKQFFVLQMVDETLINCAENPHGGAYGVDPLTVDGLKPPEPTDPHVETTWIPDDITGTENTTIQPMSMRVVPVEPPKPDPDPNPGDPAGPPIAATPEPSTFAILGITAAVLLFLLFGRQCGRRFVRRI